MHVHRAQFDPNLQLNYLGAAAKAEARKAAERTRKRLLEGASSLLGDEEDCVVRLGAQEDSQDDAKQRQNDEKREDGRQGAGSPDELFSDYA